MFYIFDLEENKMILKILHHDIITSVLMNKDENLLVIGSFTGKITFYNDILNVKNNYNILELIILNLALACT